MENEPLKVYCRNCQAKLDVSDLKPYTKFPCPECGTVIRVPERFGRYLLEKVCGTGGMAVIYRALDTKLARRVAVKITREKYADGRDFFETSRMINCSEHPAVVPVYDCGIYDNRPFMVMKYMDGGDLEKRMLSQTLPPVPKLAGYLAFIASGLNAMAGKGIAHHDVKPANIMLDSSDEAKLGDFDLADFRTYGDVNTTCAEYASPGYASPERLYYGGEDQRGDIFSLGATIYELLSGKLPFGIHGTPEELYRKRENMEFAPLSSVAEGIPDDFSVLISSVLSFNMESRPGYSEIISGLSRLSESSDKESGLRWTDKIANIFKRSGRKGEQQ
jgi:serine/threonine-protein kinase